MGIAIKTAQSVSGIARLSLKLIRSLGAFIDWPS